MGEKIVLFLLLVGNLFAGVVLLITLIGSSPLLGMGIFTAVLYFVYYILLKYFFDENRKE